MHAAMTDSNSVAAIFVTDQPNARIGEWLEGNLVKLCFSLVIVDT